jgi:hypothetical protein
VTVEDVQLAEQRRAEQAAEAAPQLFPGADMRRRDQRAAALHGRLVKKRVGRNWLWGRVNFKGAHHRPVYFKLVFADGTVVDEVSHRMLTMGKAYSLQAEGRQAPQGVVVPEAEAV